MPDLHVVHYGTEFRIVGKHVAGCVAGRIVAQERPHARLALLGGFNDGLNAVQNVVVKKAIQPTQVNRKTRVAHGAGIKSKRGGHCVVMCCVVLTRVQMTTNHAMSLNALPFDFALLQDTRHNSLRYAMNDANNAFHHVFWNAFHHLILIF